MQKRSLIQVILANKWNAVWGIPYVLLVYVPVYYTAYALERLSDFFDRLERKLGGRR